ncbi:MAG: transcription antitermination factor NusB [Sulfurospirillaceae bacterium]|nr:transcription antitermination factor NusB [Sulfurospirillaceae bacterium]MDD3462651.1 transcription antitermination factor NusB [Sulfurospirillaceae bacterium]
MATRHQVRECVVGLLYAFDIGNKEIEKFIDELFEEKKIRNHQKEFALGLFNGVKDNCEAIDLAINNHLKEWELDKIGNVERAILRLGAYEILHSSLDNAVIINEAIELSKELCNDTSPKFINGVLDAICKELEK